MSVSMQVSRALERSTSDWWLMGNEIKYRKLGRAFCKVDATIRMIVLK